MGCGRVETHPDRADWGRAADGIGLAGIAVFLLLNTTGSLPWSFWIDAIPLWPLLIISAGLKITFEKTRVPWLVLLGPALWLGALAYVAATPRFDDVQGPWVAEGPLPRPEGAERVKLDLDLFGSRLNVEARPLEAGAVADARSIERLSSSKLVVNRVDDTAELRLDAGTRRGVVILPGRRQRWELGVPTDLPLRYELDGVMVKSRLDLAHSRFEGGQVNGVFLATQLELPAPPSAEPVKLELRGVFNVLHVSVPEGTPVRVHGTGFPFNIVKPRQVGDSAATGYDIKLDGIFSVVKVETRPAAEGADAGGHAHPPAEAPVVPQAPEAAPEATPAPPASVRG